MRSPDRSAAGRRRLVPWLLRLALSVTLLLLVFRLVPLTDVLSTLGSAHVGFLTLAWALTVLNVYLAACQLKLLTSRQRLSPSTLRIFEINLATHFYGLFLPAYLSGGAIRWYKLAQKDRRPAEALTSIVFNRFVDTLMLVALGLVFWALDPRFGSGLRAPLLLGGLVAVGLLYLAAFRSGWTGAVRRRVSGSRWLPESFRRRAEKLLDSIIRGQGLSRADHRALLLFSLARCLLGVAGLWMLARAVTIDVALASLGWVHSTIRVAVMAPVTVSGFGVREGGLALLLQPYSVATAEAIALSFLMFSRTLIKGALGALVEARHWLGESRAPA